MTREVNFHNVAFQRAQQFVDRPRLVVGLCAAVAIALIAAIPGLRSGDGGGRSVRAQALEPYATTTTSTTMLAGVGIVSPVAPPPAPDAAPAETTTTAPAQVLGIAFTRATTTTTVASKAAPKPAGATTTTIAPKGSPPTSTCRNSYDPACGPFRWDPAPGPNQPITGGVTASQPAPGAKVTFTVTGEDPDAAPLQVCNVDFGDGSGYHCDPTPVADPSACPKQYGPWTPPAKNDGKLDSPWDHTYSNAGSYHVTFEVFSAMQDCNNPYASEAMLQADIVVS